MSRPARIPPTVTKITSAVGETEERHPAYGQIGWSRMSCTPGETLYGSDFRHRSVIRIQVRRSTVKRGLSTDWPHPVWPGGEIVDIEMSEAQFAAFVSTPNSGEGTQCTLTFTEKDGRLPGIEEQPKRVDHFINEVRADLEDALKQIAELKAAVQTAPSLSAAKRKELTDKADRAQQQLAANLPFVVKTFGEHVETTTEKAKTEVHAYIEGHIRRAGLEAIAAGTAPPLELPPAQDQGLVISGTADDD